MMKSAFLSSVKEVLRQKNNVCQETLMDLRKRQWQNLA